MVDAPGDRSRNATSRSSRSLRVAVAFSSVVLLLVVVVSTFAVHDVLSDARHTLSLFVAAGVGAILLTPLVELLGRWMRRIVAITVSVILLIAVTGLVAWGVLGDVNQQIERLQEAAPNAAAEIEQSDRFGRIARDFRLEERVTEAVDEFEKFLRREPDSVPANTMVGVLLERQGQLPEAETRYKQALKADPRAAVAANNLAWLYADSGRNLDEALQLAQVASEGLPDQAEVIDTLGWVYYRKELHSLALPLLKRVAQQDPKNPLYRYHLGMALFAAGDTVQAKQHLSQALTLNPKFPGSDEARKTLAAAG